MPDIDTDQIVTAYAVTEGGKVIHIYNDHDDATKNIQPGQDLYLLELAIFDGFHYAICDEEGVIHGAE